MLILQSFAPGWGEPSPSPFCVKAMCLLQMSGRDWRPDFKADVRKAPYQKLPVLLDGTDVIADSNAIAAHLGLVAPGLSELEAARAIALTRLLEEHLYWILVRERWTTPEIWPALKEGFFANLPFPLKAMIPWIVRRDLVKALQGQGVGRLPEDMVLERARHDFEALAAELGDTPYLFGSTPVAVDASAIAILNSIGAAPMETPLSRLLDTMPTLKDYAARGREALYPDPSLWQKGG